MDQNGWMRKVTAQGMEIDEGKSAFGRSRFEK